MALVSFPVSRVAVLYKCQHLTCAPFSGVSLAFALRPEMHLLAGLPLVDRQTSA